MAWFFNNLHLDPVGRIPVFAGIAKTLDTLAPTDRVVLFAYNRSFTMEMFPAFDRPAIDRALEKIRARVPGGGRFDDIAYKKTLEALAAATTALAGLPGPKALVYITGSLPEPVDSRSDRVMTALYLGRAANRLGIEAKLGPVRQAPKGMLKVDLEVRFPFARLALLPEDAMRKGRVRLYLASRDGQGQVSEVTEVVLPLNIPEKHLAAVLADKVTYTTQLLLRPEEGAVTIGVRDELGNVDSALIVPWSPPPA